MDSIRFLPDIGAWCAGLRGRYCLDRRALAVRVRVCWRHGCVTCRVVLGIGLIVYSLITKYELGIPGIKFVPMPIHPGHRLCCCCTARAFAVALRLRKQARQCLASSPDRWRCGHSGGAVSQTHPKMATVTPHKRPERQKVWMPDLRHLHLFVLARPIFVGSHSRKVLEELHV